MLGVRTLFMAAGLLFGVGIGLALSPPIEVVEAADYLPIPKVGVSCDGWVVEETGPDYFWDAVETSTSTADYWTVETLGKDGGIVRSEEAEREQNIEVSPSADGFVNVVWWDSDRPGNPQELSRVAVLVGDC